MSTSTKRIYNLLTIGVLLLIFLFVPIIRYSQSDPTDRTFVNLGLDLKGGVDLVLAVDRKQYKGDVRKEQMEGAIEILRRKIDPGGVKEIVVQQVGDERIAVQVPGAKDPKAVKEIIGRPEALKWLNTGTQYIPARTIVRFVDDVSVLEKEEAAKAEKEGEAAGGTEPEATGQAEKIAGTPGETAEGAESAPVDVTEGGTVQGTTTPDQSQYPEEFNAALKSAEEKAQGGEGETTSKEGAKKDEKPVIITDPNSDKNQIVITGEDLELVQTTFYNNKPVVSFRITREAAGKFSKHTGSHIGQYMAIALNDEIISCPVIRSRIGRQGQIEGFTTDEAKQLELLLNAGRIPVPLNVVQERTVSPTLGAESIRLSVRASIWGLCLILLFMLLYYRLPGLIADMALLMYAVFFMGAMVMLNATLTLPGIAGVAITLGMAVDANVLIFERLKEEMAAGKTVATAVKDAFKRAWTAILDSNITTLITGFILWSIGSGPIKGFAVTLCLGVLLSMFSAIYITRNLLEAFVAVPSFQNRWLLGAKRGVK